MIVSFFKRKDTIDKFVGALQKDFVITDEGEVNACLRIDVQETQEGFKLTQAGPIQRYIESMGEHNNKTTRDIPATTRLLFKDLEGEQRQLDFDYRSIIGMLMYLIGTSRPELAFTMHQCA